MEQDARIRMWKGWSLGLAIGLLVSWPRLGWGQRGEFYKSEIRALFKEGKGLAERKNYQAARVKFFAALKLLERLKEREKTGEGKKPFQASEANFFYFLGRMYFFEGEREGAIRYYRRCAEHMPESRAAKICRKELRRLRAKLLPDRPPQARGPHERSRAIEPARQPPSTKPTLEEGSLPPASSERPTPSARKVEPRSPGRMPETVLRWDGSAWQRVPLVRPPSPLQRVALSKSVPKTASQGSSSPSSRLARLSQAEVRSQVAPPSWALPIGWTFAALGLIAAIGATSMGIAYLHYNDSFHRAREEGTQPSGNVIKNYYEPMTVLTALGWVTFGVAVVSASVASFAFVKARPAGLPPTTKAEIHVQGGGTTLFERW